MFNNNYIGHKINIYKINNHKKKLLGSGPVCSCETVFQRSESENNRNDDSYVFTLLKIEFR